jgi:transaldolase / glucose-6-phosphate isomerase
VSLEVSPVLAYDTVATLDEARRLWRAVGRDNLMIKVPATPQGIVAVHELIGEGINVNVTLLFARNAYEQVAEAYIAGLEAYGSQQDRDAKADRRIRKKRSLARRGPHLQGERHQALHG